MGKLSYALKRARKMDYRAMFKTADMLHKKTGKSLADGRYGQVRRQIQRGLCRL